MVLKKTGMRPHHCVSRLEKQLWRFFTVTLLLLLMYGCAARPAAHETAAAISDNRSPVERELGVEVVAIRLTAGGYMLDFRYRAIDPERAVALFDRQIKPYLVHEATQAKFLVPAPAKVGPLRQTTNKPVAGKVYFMMFANPGQYIKAGDKVTIVFDELRIEHLQVK